MAIGLTLISCDTGTQYREAPGLRVLPHAVFPVPRAPAPTFLLGRPLFVCYQTRLLIALTWSPEILTALEMSRMAAKVGPEKDYL